jgi:uncharacterized integral membrane protein
MTVPANERSFSGLLSDAISQLNSLVRNEIQLARAELSAKAGQAAGGLALLAVSAVIMIAALVLIFMALAGWLVGMGFSPPAADLIVGLLGAGVSGGFLWFGVSRLRAEDLSPRRTLKQLHRDASVAKELVK